MAGRGSFDAKAALRELEARFSDVVHEESRAAPGLAGGPVRYVPEGGPSKPEDLSAFPTFMDRFAQAVARSKTPENWEDADAD